MRLDIEVREAIRDGHVTARQRREWTREHWALYNDFKDLEIQKLQAAEREAYENSPQRLRERLDALETIVESLREKL